MVEDRHLEQAEAFALGALEAAVAELPRSSDTSPLAPEIRAAVLDLAEAPSLPLDPAAYAWEECYPGVRTAVVKEDAARAFCASLIWASPGARYPAHRHHGDESTLILQGACRDEHGSYVAGDVARMRAGSTHSVEFLPGEDCIGYLVAYHGHEVVEG